MATYPELFNEGRQPEFQQRCGVACAVLADTIAGEATPSDAEKAWAARCFANPLNMGKLAAYIVLAANKDATLATIQAATDATLQTNVDAARAVLVASGS